MENGLIQLTITAYALAVILMNMASPNLRIVIGLTYVLFMGGAAYDQLKTGPEAAETAITQVVDTAAVDIDIDE